MSSGFSRGTSPSSTKIGVRTYDFGPRRWPAAWPTVPRSACVQLAKEAGFRAVETFFGAADESLAREVGNLAHSEERPSPAADSPSAAVDEKVS